MKVSCPCLLREAVWGRRSTAPFILKFGSIQLNSTYPDAGYSEYQLSGTAWLFD